VSDDHTSAHLAANALLVIDAQRGLLCGEQAVPQAALVVAHIKRLLTAARTAGSLIVYLQNDGESGSIDAPGTSGWSIHPDLRPEEGEIVLRKRADDGFVDTPLEEILRDRGARRIAVAGLLSEMCVSATVRSALARCLQVVLVRDAHATYPIDDIPATVVARVAEHALGDEVELRETAHVVFEHIKK
jgi:nicotinamidase-related amidase